MGMRIVQKVLHVIHRVQHGLIAAGDDCRKTNPPITVGDCQNDRATLGNNANVAFFQGWRNRRTESPDLVMQVDIIVDER